ncbi:30S ribosomal protein S6 [Clostridium vitabionis]|uniref:30S ribosomal protein S6 n=1 Tax=Clostridium vitabionis TaxID=2784388 RepID=UPI00188D203B|nr:30S ribosomal protein S6 [Clostridium vitabionis]
MNQYELALVLSTKIEDEDRAAALEKIQGYITRFGGTVKDIEDGGRKKLAYEIQKEKEGYYSFIHFEAPATTPAEVESRVRIMEPVLRYLCVRQDA